MEDHEGSGEKSGQFFMATQYMKKTGTVIGLEYYIARDHAT